MTAPSYETVKRWRERNRDRYLERMREWKTANGEKRAEQQRRYRERYPEKIVAQNALNGAVRSGKIVRPDRCESCGAGGPIEAHHDDYGEKLKVRWLCPACHRKEQ